MPASYVLLAGLTLVCLVLPTVAHGRLTVPTSRQSRNLGDGNRIDLQNGPVSGLTDSDFICRDQPDPADPYVDVTAGGSIDLSWTFSAAHIGDCFLYVSYDLDVADPAQREWFKLSNLAADEASPVDCRLRMNMPFTVALPDWLPAGRAVFRWEWYALHQAPASVEYYSQCFDAEVTNVGSPSLYSTIKTQISPRFTIGTHLPASGNDYRSGFSPSCENDLRLCGGKGMPSGQALGDDFLVGPEIATFSNPNTTPSTSTTTSIGRGGGGGGGGGGSDGGAIAGAYFGGMATMGVLGAAFVLVLKPRLNKQRAVDKTRAVV